MPIVTYVDSNGASTPISVESGDNAMHGAVYHGVEGIVGECGGGLACATCHCYVDDAWMEAVGGPSSQDEIDMLESTASEVRPTSRLACQITVSDEMDGLIIHLPERQF
mgnify:FL=1|jgi:2Fe-2S ferredoxin